MKNPFVSILIPTYNREKLIAESIQSALDQDYDNVEVVVVDNASTDGTWEQIQRIASADARVRAFRNDTNIGPVRNWIECARNARGTFSKILWSDDLIAPDFVSSTLPLFDENVGFVYTGVRIFGSKRSNSYYMRGATGTFPSRDYIAAALHGWNVPYSPGCVILRTADLQRFLVADIPNRVCSDFSQHAIGNDLFLLLMVAEAGLSMLLAGRSLVEHLALYALLPHQVGLAGQLVFAMVPWVQARGACAGGGRSGAGS